MPAAENTLVIIKPDLINKKNNILQLLEYNGFRITHKKIISFSPEQAAEFYKDLEKQDPHFAIKVMSLSRGPSEALILNKVNAVKDLLTILNTPSCCQDKIHASVSIAKAEKEIRYIFPNVILEPSRKVHFGTICGHDKLTRLLAEGIFDVFECQTEDIRGYLSEWLSRHSYVFESN